MKTLFGFSLIALFNLAACTNSNTSKVDGKDAADSNASQSSTAITNRQDKSQIANVVSAYLQLKNALTNDDSKDAATAANNMSESLKGVDVNNLSPEEKKIYQDVADDLKEHAEHIAGSSDKIAHQREHFETMSKDLYDLVKVSKQGRTLYKDFCPMYNNEKGGMWLSETKDIKNPYLGKKMPDCGEMQEEITKR